MADLVITFPALTPAPTKYIVRYRPVGSTDAYTSVMFATALTIGQNSALTVSGVVQTQNLEGDVQAFCSDTRTSARTEFLALGVAVPDAPSGIRAMNFLLSQRYDSLANACQQLAPDGTSRVPAITNSVFRRNGDTNETFDPFYFDQAGTQVIPNGYYYAKSIASEEPRVIQIYNAGMGLITPGVMAIGIEYNEYCMFPVSGLQVGFTETTLAYACASSPDNAALPLFTATGRIVVGKPVYIRDPSGQTMYRALPDGFVLRNDGGVMQFEKGVLTQLNLSCVGQTAPPYKATDIALGSAQSSVANACAQPVSSTTTMTYAGELGLRDGDVVYKDAYGTQPFPAGFYRGPDLSYNGSVFGSVYQISNSKIVKFYTC